MTLPDPINKQVLGGLGRRHEEWHEDMHITSNLIFSGTATPEGAVTAPVGSIFLRTDGAAGTTLYTKQTGAGNTGWFALAGV